MNMTDLKYGNVVELRNCERYLYNGVSIQYSFIKLNGMSYIGICDYNNDLTNIHNYHQFDIMKVYKDYTLNELLWERKEETLKLSDDERVILRNIDEKYKYIARDEDGNLFVYKNKPIKRHEYWSDSSHSEFCFNHLFQFIKWEDEEPYLIEDLLNGN